MESVYENLKNHFRRKLSCFRLELLGFDLLKGVAVVLFTFLLFLFFYAGLLSFFRLLPDFKYVLYLILFLLLGVEFFSFLSLLPFIRFFLVFSIIQGYSYKTNLVCYTPSGRRYFYICV